jgi:hypothetical protein
MMVRITDKFTANVDHLLYARRVRKCYDEDEYEDVVELTFKTGGSTTTVSVKETELTTVSQQYI